MSSVLPERRLLQPRTPFIRIEARTLATVALACAASFALSFAFGHALRPTQVRGVPPPAFGATQASAEIPVRLSTAPAIGLPRVAVVRTAKPARTAVTQQPSSQPPAPASAQPPVVLTPAPTKAVAPAPALTPVPAKTPASSNPAGAPTAPKQGGGISFDSSG